MRAFSAELRGDSHLIAYQAVDEGTRLAKLIGLGSRCDVDFADIPPFLAEEDEARCQILLIEGQDAPRSQVWKGDREIRLRTVLLSNGPYIGG